MKRDFIFSSESVTEGHPDKLCDRISDALVGQYLRRDPLARVTAECAVATGILFVAVRLGADAVVDVPYVARDVIREVGYERDGRHAFNARDCTVMTTLSEFDRTGADLVDEAAMSDADIERVVARDQVTVFGYACTHTPVLMPLPVVLAHRLARRLALARAEHLPELLPDGKTQVSVEFHDRQPVRLHGLTVVTTLRDDRDCDLDALRARVRDVVVGPAFKGEALAPDAGTRIDINPEGASGGGPAVHSGLTGRKTAADTYGGYARHSAAALCGKDPSRIDRVAAYAARHAARNVVAAGLASECEVQLTYAIGLSRPVSVQVETFGTHGIDEAEIERRVRAACDFRPASIVRRFGLRALPASRADGFYPALAAYGHFGRNDVSLPWEQDDLADLLAGGLRA